MLLLMAMISVLEAAVDGSAGLGVTSEAAPKAFHRMVLLGEIVPEPFAVMVAGELKALDDMFWLLKLVALAEEKSHGALEPPMVGTSETF